MTNTQYCFVHNFNTHSWYLIPVELRNEFDDFIERASITDIIWSGTDFEVYKSLNPVNYMFSDVKTLKVN